MEQSTFYLNKTEPNQSCLLAMQAIVLQFHNGFSETIKYGSPCFIYLGKPLVYLWLDKKTSHPYYLFVEGKHLSHPKLEAGDRKRMKIYRIDPSADIDIDEVNAILAEAIMVQEQLQQRKR